MTRFALSILHVYSFSLTEISRKDGRRIRKTNHIDIDDRQTTHFSTNYCYLRYNFSFFFCVFAKSKKTEKENNRRLKQVVN